MTADKDKPEVEGLDAMLESFADFMKREDELRRFTFPIEVAGVDWNVAIGIKSKSVLSMSESKPGSFVAIRSCKEAHGDKTYLGLLIGYVPIHTGLGYDKVTKRLRVDVAGDNPAIYVFDLGEVVLGAESYWGPIKDEAHLREITKDDIENVWYIKALKALASSKDKSSEGPEA
jgi:hypothetical protein